MINMKIAKFYHLSRIVFLFFLATGLKVSGQHANSWINYSQDYVKLVVSDSAIHSVSVSSLPGDFQNNLNKLQLWHRGKQVAFKLANSNSAILFYGVSNDGTGDEFLYKNPSTFLPDPSQRTDIYYSLFSDKSAYFLTKSESTDPNDFIRIAEPTALTPGGAVEPFHWATEVKTFRKTYSHSVDLNFASPTYFQSFFQSGKGFSSIIHGKASNRTAYTLYPEYKPLINKGKEAYAYGDLVLEYNMANLYVAPENPNALAPQVSLLLYGRTGNANNITVQTIRGTPTAATVIRNIPGNILFSDFVGIKKDFELDISEEASDVDTDQKIKLRLFSNIDATSSATGLYSITYARVSYPEKLNMENASSKYFYFPATANAESHVLITNVPANSIVWDVTDRYNPIVISGQFSGGNFEANIARTSGKTLLLYIAQNTQNITSVGTARKYPTNDPANSEYLIIASDHLIDEVRSSDGYEAYRSSDDGGSFNVSSRSMTDIYDQFNYGEINPLAIRNYVSYMISSGVNTRQNLLLVGHSESIGDSITANRDLPNQVPTYGYPGSDPSLIENMGPNASLYVPVIPIGRITATTAQQLANYLAKVKEHEAAVPTSATWRKEVLTINGGKFEGESNQWNGFFNTYNAKVTGSPFSGSPTHHAKDPLNLTEPLPLNITTAINNGVGFTAYFGHGNPHYMDNNIGYATDNNRGYANSGKYPLMYFNGCGVGNIFKGSTVAYTKHSGLSTSDTDKNLPENVLSVSADWLLAPSKGAIAIIANSYYAYVTSSRTYLDALYDQLFKNNDSNRKTIGHIHRIVANTVKPTGMSPDPTIVLNTNQSTLQGDPALRMLLTTDSPLPVNLVSFKATYQSESQSVSLGWMTSSEKNNSHFVVERSADAKNFTTIGRLEGGGTIAASKDYYLTDANPLKGINYYRLNQVDTDGKNNYSNIVSAKVPVNEFFKIYPNPSKDLVKIILPEGQTLKSWTLTDKSGKILRNGFLETINISRFATGLYVLKITTSQNLLLTKTIVKE